MSRLRAVTLATLLATLPASTAFAGAWTHDQWHFYLQLGTAFSYANDAYAPDGSTLPIFVRTGKNDTTPNKSNFQQLLSDLYFEVGLLDRLTIFGDLGYSSNRQMNPGGDIKYSTNALNDWLFGFRVGLIKGDPLAVALEARLTVPTGFTGNTTSPLPTGTGDVRGELRLAVAKQLPYVPIYVDGEFGFALRGSGKVYDPNASSNNFQNVVNYAPELVIHGEIGAALVKWKGATRLLLIASVDYRGSTTKQVGGLGDTLLSLTPENSEVTSISGALMWYAWHGLGIQARFQQIVEGLRIPKITTFGGSIFVDY
jgi:hypothetical protein